MEGGSSKMNGGILRRRGGSSIFRVRRTKNPSNLPPFRPEERKTPSHLPPSRPEERMTPSTFFFFFRPPPSLRPKPLAPLSYPEISIGPKDDIVPFPGHALHEKGVKRQTGVGTLASSQERRALAVLVINRGRTADKPVVKRLSIAGFVPPSVYIGIPLFVLPKRR